jgi:transcriptional regulator with XRE-family HTH domain
MPRPNGRDPETDPAALLGEHLRDLRIDAGYATQADFAARIGYGQDVISRAETGGQPPSNKVFGQWMDACQATPRERRILAGQLKLARKARGPIPQFIEKWFANEARATFLRLWALMFMPGQLQTREYAHAMFLAGGLDEAEAAEKAEIRIGRQAIFDGPDPAHVTAVIHERALYFLVGTPEIMIAQLQRLAEMSRKPDVVIQVVPDTGYFPGLRGPFEIASGEAIPDTLLMLTVEDQMMEDTALTRKVIALFEEIRGYALNVADSRAVIVEAIEEWKRRQP